MSLEPWNNGRGTCGPRKSVSQCDPGPFHRGAEQADRQEQRLTRFLLANGCDVIELNSAGRKNVRHLSDEIRAGEATLRLEPSHVVRLVVSAAVSIHVPSRGCTFGETGRVFPGGLVTTCTRPWSIRETVKVDEDPLAAAERGLAEELNLRASVPFVTRCLLIHEGMTIERRPSEAYVGLLSERTTHSFIINLPDLPWQDEIKQFTDHCGTRISIKRFHTTD